MIRASQNLNPDAQQEIGICQSATLCGSWIASDSHCCPATLFWDVTNLSAWRAYRRNQIPCWCGAYGTAGCLSHPWEIFSAVI